MQVYNFLMHWDWATAAISYIAGGVSGVGLVGVGLYLFAQGMRDD